MGNFGSVELEQFRDEVSTKINDNDDGLTPDSEFVDILDVVLPHHLVILSSIIRLAFHDCAGTGICDGCIDITSLDNVGLYEGAILPFNNICSKYKLNYGLSIADCWALAATFSVEISADKTDEEWLRLGQTPPIQTVFPGDIPYYIGRKDTNQLCDIYYMCVYVYVRASKINKTRPTNKTGLTS